MIIFRLKIFVITPILAFLFTPTGNADSPQAVQVAPGIWRIRIGVPETQGNPSQFRVIPANTQAMEQLPNVNICPLRSDTIQSSVSPRGLRIELPYESEIIYGLGLQGDTFQQQRKFRFLMNNCTVLNGLGPGHASFPYYVNSEGYAVLFDTSRYVRMRIGTNARKSRAIESTSGTKSSGTTLALDDVNTLAEDIATDQAMGGKPFLVEIPVASGIDIYVFAGPSMLEAIQRYNLYSGGGVLPPLWGLGVKFRMESLASQEQVIELAKHFRERKLPFNVIALEPGWHTKSYSCSFVWNAERFDHKTLLEELFGMDYRLDLWEHPFIHPTSPYYQGFYDNSGDFAVFGGLVPDLATQEGFSLYSRIHENLMDLGAMSFKIDANDNVFHKGDRVWPFPDSTEFPSGLDGEQMHQVFGILTQQAVMQPFIDRNLRTFGETRCSGPYAAPYPFTLFSDMYNHEDYYRMIVAGGFSGLLWQPEIRRGKNFDEYYARIQMAVLSPAVTFNNYMMPYPAWMQNDPDKNKQRTKYTEAEIRRNEDILRPLLEQRMRLIPYLYSAYKQYEMTGLPPFRALILDYPQDTKCTAIDDQMMIGDSLLGYVFLNGARSRNVYLPAGIWYDFNTGERYEGGASFPVKFEPTQIPAFVKGNSILPLAEPVQSISRQTVFQLTCHIFGDEPTDFVLYEDDGETFDYKTGAQNRCILKWNKEGGATLHRDGSFPEKRYDLCGVLHFSDATETKTTRVTQKTDLEAALEKLQNAGLMIENDVDYFRQHAKPGLKVEGVRMVPVFISVAKYHGGSPKNLIEAINTLKEKRVISPSNDAWNQADLPDNPPHMGGGTAMTLVRLAQSLK